MGHGKHAATTCIWHHMYLSFGCACLPAWGDTLPFVSHDNHLVLAIAGVCRRL